MPREKEGKQKTKGIPVPIVPILQKFLKTYEKHCAQTQTFVCPAIKQDLKTSISSEQILRKFMLVRPEDSPPSIPPISLEPLLMTIQDECYMLGKEICIWSLQLSNPEIARLASLLELRGCAACPFTSLELIDCRMDLWSLGRLGRALSCSCLRSLVLDYCSSDADIPDSLKTSLYLTDAQLPDLMLIPRGCAGMMPMTSLCKVEGLGDTRFGNEEIENIFSGLENNQRLQVLSLRYCGLGPQSGPRLGAIICQSSICELHLDGNCLQCSGALALLRPAAEYAEKQGRDQPATSPPDLGSPPQQLQVKQRGSSTLNQTTKSPGALPGKTTAGKEWRKKGIKKKIKDLTEAGPWLVKLYLADNGIDGKGKEGENGLLEFTQILTCLITYSAHLREIDLGNNVLGEMAAADILEALRARKTGKLPVLKIIITPQVSSDIFRSVWKNSKKSSITRKKKKEVKN